MNEVCGVIYILTNPSFPEYVKIGYANDLEKRLEELNRSECIPFAFRVYAYYEVQERLQDKTIHNMIDNINPNLRAIESFNGKKRKKEFYAMSPDDAYLILEAIAKASSTIDRLHKGTPSENEKRDMEIAEEIENGNVYSEDAFFTGTDENIKSLYHKLREVLLSFGDVKVEAKKFYIAFKNPKNFVDIEVQKHALKLYLNMRKGKLKNSDSIASDVSGLGHWGNGDYRIYLKDDSEFDSVIDLIKQSYDSNKKSK